MQLKKILSCLALACACTAVQAFPDSSATTAAHDYTYAAPTTVFGIYDPLNVPLGEQRFAISAYGDLYLASNCFSASFLQNFFGSGFITEEMKDFAAGKLSAENTFGVDVYAGLWMQMAMQKNPDNIFLAGIDYNFEESSQFTPDLFHLAFYGNYDYQNYEAQLTGSNFSLTNVMEYKVGMMKLLNDDFNDFKVGAAVGLVQGLSGLDVKTRYGTLFTAVDGRYIDLDYNLTILSSGKGVPSLGQFKGMGVSADLFWQGYFKGPEITVNLMANDIGTVWWMDNPVKITGDSLVRFEGIELDNFFSASDDAIAGEPDSLLSILGVQEEPEDVFSQALPSRMNISATKLLGAYMTCTLGAQYMLNTPYKPLVFVQVAKVFSKPRLTIAANAHAGGYGVFNAGIDLSKSFGNHFHLRLGSNSVLGIIAPDVFTGLGAYGAATVTF